MQCLTPITLLDVRKISLICTCYPESICVKKNTLCFMQQINSKDSESNQSLQIKKAKKHRK